VSGRARQIAGVAVVGLCWLAAPMPARAQAPGQDAIPSREALGAELFFDIDLSKNRTQACASCHDPGAGFVDPRPNASGRAVSTGDDGSSLGDRNAPTAAYARFSLPFGPSPTKPGVWRGGQFHDGRAADLAAQAAGPPLNPIEMGQPDAAAVVARLKEKRAYVDAFDRFFGPGTLDDPKRGYAAMTQAIASFEATELFAPFDSKYDRFLRGEITLTDQEELGRVLFFSKQFTSCNQCHQLNSQAGAAGETFSSYEFHNIGVPVNRMARTVNGKGPTFVDRGLLANPRVKNKRHAGQFKTPTLRNVAVTGPYMHNGVFQDLRTVVLFYNSYNTKNPERLINPETGKPFEPPEVPGTLSRQELEHGPALDDQRIDALVAFLKTLTDQRYEPLLKEAP
jgi:cytochrome c peroxidase